MPRANPSLTKPTTPNAVVIGIEMPGFVKLPVPEQLRARENLHGRLKEALRPLRQQDRIVLDTGSGAAIALFGSPSVALVVTSVLCAAERADKDNFSLRVVLTTGPIQALSRENGEIQVAGDSLDVAERILALPSAEQVLVTRAFASALRNETPGCDAALKSLGTITDDQVREHELFVLNPAHPSFAASGRPGPARGGWPMPRAILAGVAIALLAFLWSNMASFGDAPASNAKPVPASTSMEVRAPVKRPLGPEIPGSGLTVSEGTGLPPAPVPAAELETKDEDEVPSQVSRIGHGKALTVTPARPAPAPGRPVKEVSIEPREVLPTSDTERGKLVLAIAPWGEVLIDGQSAGISPPLTELKLSPGAHYVEVRNGGFAPVLKRIEIQANETLKIRHRFADAR